MEKVVKGVKGGQEQVAEPKTSCQEKLGPLARKSMLRFFNHPPCVCVSLCGWQSLKRHFSHSGTISKPAKVERTSIASSEPPQLLYCILFLSLFRLPSLFAFLLRLLPVALSRR